MQRAHLPFFFQLFDDKDGAGKTQREESYNKRSVQGL